MRHLAGLARLSLSRPRAALTALALAALALAGLPAASAGQTPTTVAVTGLDYAFQAPDTVKAGPVMLTFANHGTVRHEVVLVLLKEGRTLGDLVRAATPEERREVYEGGAVFGILIAMPGQRSLGRLAVDLAPGRTYVLLCNFRDAPEKPPHTTLGMIKGLYAK